MKKISALCAVLIIALTLCGCSKEEQAPANSSTAAPADAASSQVCISNRQTITTYVNALVTGAATGTPVTKPFSFTISYNGASAAIGNVSGISEDTVKGVFTSMPYCPVNGSIISVKVTFDESGLHTVKTACSIAGHS